MRQLASARLRRVVPALIAASLLLSGCAAGEGQGGGAGANGLIASEQALVEKAAQARAGTISCLQDRGWDVRPLPDGWEINGIDQSQSTAFDKDTAECRSQSGEDDIRPLPLSDERLERIYEHELITVDCLRKQGFEIPEPPTKTTFKERYGSNDPWVAYAFVDPGTIDETTWNELQATCPQYGSSAG